MYIAWFNNIYTCFTGNAYEALVEFAVLWNWGLRESPIVLQWFCNHLYCMDSGSCILFCESLIFLHGLGQSNILDDDSETSYMNVESYWSDLIYVSVAIYTSAKGTLISFPFKPSLFVEILFRMPRQNIRSDAMECAWWNWGTPAHPTLKKSQKQNMAMENPHC